MKTFYKYAAVVAVSLLGLCACSSDDDSSGKVSGKTPVEQPQIVVSDLTTTGFAINWNAVEEAGSYVYTFNGGDATTVTDCRIVFDNLERQKEYVVAVKSCPRDPAEYTESDFTYVHVLTDDLEQLPQPKITLGSAYASKTVISWTEVPEAGQYEVILNEQQAAYTTGRTLLLSNLEKGQSYTISVRAMTSDATRFNNSEAARLSFVTSDDDVPPIIIAPKIVISDAVAFDIHAASDQTYYYEILPATTFIKYSEKELMTAFQTYLIDFAKKQGISFQLAMATLLKSGMQSLQITGLTSELSYVIFAFGMDLKGNITTNLCTTQFKTTADGYSDGPNYGGSDWFTQRFFISNAYGAYNVTNSAITYWKGRDVIDLRYRVLSTSLFNQLFPDPNDKQAISAFLKDPSYGKQLAPELLSSMVNNNIGSPMITENLAAGTSYTSFALATSASGEETLCVNSVTTKTGTASSSWFAVSALTYSEWGPTYNTIGGIMQGVEIASARYALFAQQEIASIDTSKYPLLIDDYGHDVAADKIEAINGNGYGLIFSGAEPETTYVFISTAINTAGDKITKWGTVKTDAAPTTAAAAAAKKAARNGAAGTLQSPVGMPIPNPEKFIFPLESHPLPEGVKPESDFWTIIHNTHNIK